MRFAARRFRLALQSNMRKPSMWLLTVCLLLFLWLIASLRMPQSDRAQGGILVSDDPGAQAVTNLLTGDFSDNVTFMSYEDEEAMTADIEAGVITCGFTFSPDFGEKMASRNLRHGVTCIETPFSVGTEVLKEAVFAAIFREYSAVIIGAKESDIFAEADPSRLDRILSKNEEYLAGDKLFTPEEILVDTVIASQESNENAEPEVSESADPGAANSAAGLADTLWGIFYTCLFLMMLQATVSDEQNARRGLLGALPPREARFYRISSEITGILVPAVSGLIFLTTLGMCESILREGLHLFLFVVYACIWIELIGRRLMRQDLGSKLVALLAAHLLLLPILTDLSSIVPAVRFLRYILPAAMYFV